MGIRMAKEQDALALRKIYKDYIENTTITFEYEVPSVEEFTGRIEETLIKYPYLVFEENGKIGGYAYAHQFMVREASKWGAELSVYLQDAFFGRGIGSAFYGALQDILYLQGVQRMYGCVSSDNDGSIKMHKKVGFQEIAVFPRCGFKHGKWLDLIWLEKVIAERENPIPFRTVWQIEKEQVAEILKRRTTEIKGRKRF